jgi:hypothetical protein
LSQEKQRRDVRDKMVEDKRIKEFERMLHMHHDDKLTDYMEEVSDMDCVKNATYCIVKML